MTAQESKLWGNFRCNSINGQQTELPDFSYAGYHHGEQSIPHTNHKIFNVTEYGAVPNDFHSDKTAIIKTIEAVRKNGSGIVFFPKGRFLVNSDEDQPTPILVKAKHIVFRGSGQGENGTEIFMKNYLPTKTPEKKWTAPFMFQFIGDGKEKYLAEVITNAIRGSRILEVSNPSCIQSGDWVALRLRNNSADLIKKELCGCQMNDKWTSIIDKGIYVNEYHQVIKVNGNSVELKEPLMRDIEKAHHWQLYSCGHSEEIGVENIAFVGNWHDNFIHHKDYIHDGGYSLLKFSRLINSWIRNCRFTNVNRAVKIGLCANVTVINCQVTGTPGHNSISSNGSTRVFLGKIIDTSSQWHAPGVAGPSIGTVLWRVKYNEDTSFETHASQPRATLLDCVEGGFFLGRGGGALQNLPNHMEYLVLWNYKELGQADKDFEFWSSKTWFWKIIPPYVVGFHGMGTTFKEDQIKVLESLGRPVKPESLYEAQLKLRLNNLPQWIKNIKETHR